MRFLASQSPIGWVVALLVVLGVQAITPAWAAPIPWKEETFTSTVQDLDVKDLLSDILKRNGQDVVFRPGVQGEITFVFNDTLLQAAFIRVTKENNLCHTFLKDTNTVEVFPCTSSAMIDHIYVPKNTSLDKLTTALRRFGVLDGSVEIKPDKTINALFLHGESKTVKNLIMLANQVDMAVGNRTLQALDKQEKALDNREKTMELANRQAALTRDLDYREKLLSLKKEEDIFKKPEPEIKVIALRFANVGTTETTFQGESVSVPGILDSLQAFIGKVDVLDENADKNTQKHVSDKPTVSIDRRTNSIIVQGTPKQIAQIEEVIRELDQPVPLVEIEVMVITGNQGITRSLGVGLGYNSQVVGGGTSKPVDSVVSGGDVNGLALQGVGVGTSEKTGLLQAASTASGLGAGFIFQGTRALLDSSLAALAKDSNIQTIASPHVVTLNNMTTKITNSESINVLINSSTNDGDKSGIQTVSAGISLDITPSVIPPETKRDVSTGLIRLEINATNSSLGDISGDSVSSESQQIQTSVIIPEGKTFVMGGLFSNTRTETEDGVPGLKDIPLLGVLFRSQVSIDSKNETVFFITPRVYTPSQIVSNMGQQERNYVRSQKSNTAKGRSNLRTSSELLDITPQSVGDMKAFSLQSVGMQPSLPSASAEDE